MRAFAPALLLAALAATGGVATGARADVVVAKGAQVRVLDRMTDQVQDFDLTPGQEQAIGRLTVRMDECRYPDDQPSQAYAHLTITDTSQVDPVFKGWMLAASPALNALDHPRYDVWLLGCDVPAGALPDGQPDSTDQGDGSGG